MSTAVRSGMEDVITAIRGEFNEMPGMRLTCAQFCRLWHLDSRQADRVIESLTTSGFLRRDHENRYGRAMERVT